MFQKLVIVAAFFAVLGIALPQFSPISVEDVQAQARPQRTVGEEGSKSKRKNLLDLLFGGGLRKNRKLGKKNSEAPAAKRVKVPTRMINKRRNTAAGQSTARAKIVVEKNEDAVKVLVVGDFMADGLAYGLQQIFAENPGITIVNNSNGLSGIVRTDVLDWPNTINAMIEDTRPVLVVVLVGMNDRQEMRISSGRVKKLSDDWRTNYEARVDALVKNVRDARLPMIWVGLPPVSSNSMVGDYLVFNEIYRDKVESYGGTFVDVWDGFVDDQGRYVRSGPNIDGQIVTLRGRDGINMTRNGKVKLGFYTEKAVKRITGIGREALFSSLGSLSDAASLQPQYDPIGDGKTIVIALGSPAADGGLELEGADGFFSASDASKSSSFNLVSRGQAEQSKKGRVDALWGKSAFDLGRSETPEPVLANRLGMNFNSFLDDLIEPAQPNTQLSSEPKL